MAMRNLRGGKRTGGFLQVNDLLFSYSFIAVDGYCHP